MIYKLLTANFNKFYKPKISSEINAEQSDPLFISFFNLIFGAFVVMTLLFRKSFWFSSRNKLSICCRHNSFKTFRQLILSLAFCLILDFKKTINNISTLKLSNCLDCHVLIAIPMSYTYWEILQLFTYCC